jgi:hypothetical protein
MVMDICDGMAEIVRLGARSAHNRYRLRTRRSRGRTLRPGTETPLWNALAAEARRRTRTWGAKVNLGRHLGVPRQRIHEFLKAGSAAPDAERVLELLLWINRSRAIGKRAAALKAALSRIT